MGIYIARGDDTLGPYTPDEAAGLIKTGVLLLYDLAARDGDTAWVPLSSLLPGETTPGASGTIHDRPADRPLRRSRVLAVILAMMVAMFLAVGVSRVVRLQPDAPRPQPSPQRSVAVVEPAARAPGPSPASRKNIRLNGVIRLVSPDGVPVPLAAVPVRAYPLRELTPYLERKKAAVQMELDRLAPLLATAESARSARLAAEHDARQALLDTAPGSDLEASLRFVRDQSQAAVKVAENDYHYLLAQRAEAMRGDAYFRELPEAAATVDTNAEGEFILDLPPEEAFAVAASVQQAARKYYWLVKVPVRGEEQETVVLSDGNEASQGSPESLIHTAP